MKKSMEMLLTGKPITAQEALLHGLVNRVVPTEELNESTISLARSILSASSEVIALGKKAFYTQIDMDIHRAYDYGESVMVDNLSLEDAQEGMSSFIEKRAPKWKAQKGSE
eukprot:TRINITY_DN4924_c0_g1_i1.p1 TRINITY_DN4924_c0_g1~~TRINITY_DN4924_c0_g1_i1.p1  ORF type:complete len:111 (-),score=25.87 TRINITY_DN4924_c0_g1_i1:29-361(-)